MSEPRYNMGSHSGLSRKEAAERAVLVVRNDVGQHFQGFAQIRMKDGKTGSPPKINKLQQKLFDAYRYLSFRGLPISIIILKPRQSGGSEGTSELVYHHARRFNLGGFMMADKDAHTDNIWRLFTSKGELDKFGSFWGNKFEFNSEKATITYVDETGKECQAIWNRGTANAATAGASGTRQIIWFSESARYAKEGQFKDSTVIGNALNSVPTDLPNTLRIAESTAEGSGGFHFETFNEAVYLEELQAGKFGNGWVRIFLAWHEVDEYTLSGSVQDAEYYRDDDPRWVEYLEEEEVGRLKHNWTPDQIAWRRKKIIRDLAGDVKLFHRDYPSTPEEAWASSGSKRFSQLAVARMLDNAKKLWLRTTAREPGIEVPVIGSLLTDAVNGKGFADSPEDAWLWMAERPEFGLRYSLVVDPMTGEQSAGSDVRDCHACMVVRDSYADKAGQITPARVVACIHVPGGCRWDIDVLADRLIILSRFYGKCIIIPEVNKAMDLIPPLRFAGCNLYQRKQRPDAVNPSERQQTIGFLSTASTRNMWVSAAAEAIREGLLECEFPPAIEEFETFIISPTGKAQAAAGKHDDWVAAYGIAWLTIGAATPMRPPQGGMPAYSGGIYGPHRGAGFAETTPGKGSSAFG